MKRIICVFVTFLLSVFIVACGNEKYNPIDAPGMMSSDEIAEACIPDVKEPLPPDTTIKFVACGDNIMYTGNHRDAKSCAVEGGRKYNFAPIYENVRSVIEGADIAFINQEVSLAGEDFGYSSYPQFNSPRDLAYDLMDAGFDIINIANNHMLDMGSSGLKSTIEFWNTLPVTLLGGYLDENDFNNIRIYEKDEVKIALLSYTYGTNGYSVKTGYSLYIPYIKDEVITRQISEAKQIADLVFVSIHWGSENRMSPSGEQTRLAALMAEQGVDVIIGHHPHVIQPVNWLEGMEGHKTLCVYSLGNFAAEMPRDYNLLGGMMTFDIVRRNGNITIENPIMLPTMYYYNKSFYKNSVHFLENFDASMAKSIGLSYYGQSTSLDRLYRYVRETIDDEFLPDWIKAQ